MGTHANRVLRAYTPTNRKYHSSCPQGLPQLFLVPSVFSGYKDREPRQKLPRNPSSGPTLFLVAFLCFVFSIIWAKGPSVAILLMSKAAYSARLGDIAPECFISFMVGPQVEHLERLTVATACRVDKSTGSDPSCKALWCPSQVALGKVRNGDPGALDKGLVFPSGNLNSVNRKISGNYPQRS